MSWRVPTRAEADGLGPGKLPVRGRESLPRNVLTSTIQTRLPRTLPQNYVLIGLHEDAKVFSQNELLIRARALQQSRTLPEVNWSEEVSYIRDGNEYPWNRSATIFTDRVREDNV